MSIQYIVFIYHSCYTSYILKPNYSIFSPNLSCLAVAQRACDLRLLTVCWTKWSRALHRKQSEEDLLQAAGHLAVRSTQRRALEHWRACILIQT